MTRINWRNKTNEEETSGKRTYQDCIINYTLELMKMANGAKNKILGFSKTNTSKDHNKSTGLQNVHRDGKKPRKSSPRTSKFKM